MIRFSQIFVAWDAQKIEAGENKVVKSHRSVQPEEYPARASSESVLMIGSQVVFGSMKGAHTFHGVKQLVRKVGQKSNTQKVELVRSDSSMLEIKLVKNGKKDKAIIETVTFLEKV